MDRKLVEEALQELRRASTKVKTWILYTKREGCDHIITIATNDPAADTKLLCPNEHLLFCAPKSVDVNAKANVVIGIANACCKAMGLHDTMKKADHPILSDVQYLFAKRFWNRCHLHQRRSIGGKKAAWRRKGYLATYHEQPDTRDRKFHEGSKLFYEVTEECRNALGQT